MKYIKLYVDKYGKIQFDHNIHHIDINRNNNNLDNLVSIPIDLHKKYHRNERQMIICFKLNNIVGFRYHRDVLISVYHEIMNYKTAQILETR